METSIKALQESNLQLQKQVDVLRARLNNLETLGREVQNLKDVEEIKVLMNKFGIEQSLLLTKLRLLHGETTFPTGHSSIFYSR